MMINGGGNIIMMLMGFQM